MIPEQVNPLALNVGAVRMAKGDGPAYERLIVLDIARMGSLSIRWAKVSAWLYNDGGNYGKPVLDLFVDGMPHVRLREITPRVLHYLAWLLAEQDEVGRAALDRDVRNGQEVRS